MLSRLLIVVFSVFVACSSPEKKAAEEQLNGSLKNSSKNITHSIGEVLSSEARKLVENWQEYLNTEKIISEYYDISITKAITNAQELSKTTQLLKDSIRVERFHQPDLKMRLNVLHNIALRLNDMNDIPEISEKEIENEVHSLISAFNSITIKTNDIINQETLEKELKYFTNEKI